MHYLLVGLIVLCHGKPFVSKSLCAPTVPNVPRYLGPHLKPVSWICSGTIGRRKWGRRVSMAACPARPSRFAIRCLEETEPHHLAPLHDICYYQLVFTGSGHYQANSSLSLPSPTFLSSFSELVRRTYTSRHFLVLPFDPTDREERRDCLCSDLLRERTTSPTYTPAPSTRQFRPFTLARRHKHPLHLTVWRARTSRPLVRPTSWPAPSLRPVARTLVCAPDR